MYGSTQQIHLLARRKRATFFQNIEKTGNFEWTEEAEEAFQKLKKILGIITSNDTTKRQRGHDAIYYSNQERCQHSNCGWERRTRACLQSVETNLLHKRSTNKIKSEIPTRAKTTLCSDDIIKKAETLFLFP